MKVVFFGNFDACLDSYHLDGQPSLQSMDGGFCEQHGQRWLKQDAVFVEALWFQGEHLGCLGFQSVWFPVLFDLCHDTVKIFISLHPDQNGVVHGDHDDLSTPGVFASLVGCF